MLAQSGSGSGSGSSNVLAIIGLAITTLGFIAAIWQIRQGIAASKKAEHASEKAEQAAENASAAVHRTVDRLAANQLLILLPQLHNVEREFQARVDADDRPGAASALLQWRQLANQTRGILQRRNDVDPELFLRIQASSGLAVGAKEQIMNPAIPLAEAIGAVAAEIAGVCDDVGALTGMLTTDAGEA